MDAKELRPARVRVPASTSNLGSGFDTVGLALDRYLVAEYEPGPGPVASERGGTLAALDGDDERDLLRTAFVSALGSRGATEPGGRLRATSAIPVAVGLGSSAAATVAGLALAAAAAGDRLDRPALLARAHELEGHPDNAAPSVFGGLVAVARDEAGRPTPIELPISPAVGFAFAAPGVGVPTRRSREALPAQVPHARAALALGRFAALLAGLESGDPDRLRLGFADELHVPFRLPLIPGADAALEAAASAGAWASTVSGGGSGLLAVCPPDRSAAVAEAMASAFSRSGGGAGSFGFAVRPEPRGVVAEEVGP